MRISAKPFIMTAALITSTVVVRPLPAEELPARVRASIDGAVVDVLAASGAPSASVAIVQDRAIAYVHAYGKARLAPETAATPEMRYSIGSISKQFTAAAVLMLAEEHKLSLDDRVVRWFPELTRAKDVTIRQILSMTSGYQDFWPEDYVMPGMLEPTTPEAIIDRWGRTPLDFEPGTRWQYSNTNYVIAGLIVEKATGGPLLDFLHERIFTPLHMTSVANTDLGPLGPGDPSRYLRYALGPLRPAPKEGSGWMFAAGELAMTAQDLARWDVSMIDESLMQSESYHAMETEVRLADGLGTGYGLGVSVGASAGRRTISHGGEVSGFTARNLVYPDDGAAVVVLTNLDATNACERIAGKIGSLLFAASDAATEKATEQARAILTGLQKGRIDRSLFTANANAYFSRQAIADFASSLEPLGDPLEFVQQAERSRGGMTMRRYTARFGKKTLRITTYTMPDGKLEQYIVAATD